MPKTYEPIQTQVLTGTQATVTFSSIPQTYTDLILITAGPTSVETDLDAVINADTGTNYSFTYVYGDGSTAISGRGTNQSRVVVGRGGSNPTGIAHFLNYANTTIYKTSIARTNLPSSITMIFVNVWRNTNAITSIELKPSTGTLSSGFTATLYGIKGA